jgi:hypothetical protein
MIRTRIAFNNTEAVKTKAITDTNAINGKEIIKRIKSRILVNLDIKSFQKSFLRELNPH